MTITFDLIIKIIICFLIAFVLSFFIVFVIAVRSRSEHDVLLHPEEADQPGRADPMTFNYTIKNGEAVKIHDARKLYGLNNTMFGSDDKYTTKLRWK
ncbi:MAG: hypothetical protein VZR00_09215 [Lachnospiraceae bacterium]|jgi:hypothetical protein|nr:hypothetical protein [Lachnospiraceae bacterium]MEE3462047.1 hypothetical protein [Lachnospiraceae bacterium]